MQLVSGILLFLSLSVAIGCQVAMGAQDRAAVGAGVGAQIGNFKAIELDGFIKQEQASAIKGKRTIKMAAPVSFEAKLKRYPEEKPMSYVTQALELSGVKPLPVVKHRMFVESAKGQIIPVYVEKQAAARIAATLKEEHRARFQGYHVYTYAKGPAILVVDFAPLR
jgi:hypothetical protein